LFLERKKKCESHTGSYTLSFAQQRVWFLHQLDPTGTLYNLVDTKLLKGSVNVDHLKSSLNFITQRHESLRTNFIENNGVPLATVQHQIELPFKLIDTRNVPSAHEENHIQKLIIHQRQQAFDLAEEPLIRVTLISRRGQKHVLIVTMHHIVSDGWSFSIFHKELWSLYAAYSAGERGALDELPIQYSDFARWQRQFLQGDVLEQQLSYWTQKLRHCPQLELPTDHPRNSVQTHEGKQVTVSLPAEIVQRLRRISQQNSCTLFMTLITAFKLLLGRYSGQTDICIGIPIASRNQTRIENLIGFFVNTLVIRTKLINTATFVELLHQVRNTTLAAYEHQDLPFEKLVSEINPERDFSRNPLFQILFNMLNIPEDDSFTVSELAVTKSSSPDGFSAKFDLTISITPREDDLLLTMIYNISLFEHGTVAMMLDHFVNLLTDITLNPHKKLSELKMLTTPHVRCRPEALQTRTFENKYDSLSAWFEYIVQTQPKSSAVKTSTGTWTYEQLNQQANRVANELIERCGKGQCRIALMFPHEATMIVALLGVLKAGKAYVPLDSFAPLRRNDSILADADVKILLTNTDNYTYAREVLGGTLPLINIDTIDLSRGTNNPTLQFEPDRPAYILHTSGSTGQPKGVIQSHRGVLYHAVSYATNIGVTPTDHVTFLSNYISDAAVLDIMSTLLKGATLHMIDTKAIGFEGLGKYLDDNKITVFHSTPTVFRQLVKAVSEGQTMSRMRRVVLGGEQGLSTDVLACRKHFPESCVFINNYGLTEASSLTQYVIPSSQKMERYMIPIGYPHKGTELMLLDDNGIQTDVYGEIAVKSSFLALGYWRQPELTKNKFMETNKPEEQIYRTGDLGRLLPDGSIECRGRKDQQVKIRGFRVEPIEIETAINSHSKIVKCVVQTTLKESEVEFSAYYVSDESLSSLLLRRYLREILPDYMIPKQFIQVDDIPIRPSGKPDYDSLSALAAEKATTRHTCDEPTTPMERRIAEIWKNLLGVQQICLSHTFFDVGGHSLLALRMRESLIRQCGVEVTFRDILYQTLAQLSHTCQQIQQGDIV